jgi:type III secretory pathway component EscS
MNLFSKEDRKYLLVVLLTLGLSVASASLVMAAMSMVQQSTATQGTTADFTRAYPWVLLAILTLLTCVLGYLLVEKDKERKEKLKEISDNFAAGNADLKEVSNKFDKIINTLFERDRDIEKRLAVNEKDLAEQRATCSINRKLCPMSRKPHTGNSK